MRVLPFELPEQNIPTSKKDEKWHRKHGNLMMHYLINKDYYGRIGQISELEQKYLAQPVNREAVTKPYGFDLARSGDYETYPLIEGIIDDIIGRYLSRPLKRKLYSINADAVNSKLDLKMDYIIEDIMRGVNKEIEQQSEVEIQTPNPDIELPEDTEEFFSKNYKTNAEELGDDLLTQFLDVNKYKDKIKYALTEYLYGDTCALYLDQRDGHPELVRVRYDEVYFDIDPEKEVQDDMEIFSFYKFYSENEIYNKHILTKKQKKKVREIFASMSTDNFNQDDLSMNEYPGTYQNCSSGVSYAGWAEVNKERRHRLRVLIMKWKSRREIKNLQFKNKLTGNIDYKLLPENYKERDRDTIETVSIETIHEVKMLGPEIVLSYGEVEERNSYIDNPMKARIPAVALIGKTHLKSANIRSVAKKLDGLQTLASDILYQMKSIINSTDGKIMIYDTAQIPKQFLDSYGAKNAINRVMHHIKRDKAVFINSKDKKDRNTFNQFSTLDLSNRGALKDLTEGLFLVEDLSRKFVGLTKEAMEGGEKYQTATAVNHSIIANNSRIEVYYEPFDSLMGSLFSKYLSKAKVVYPEGKVFPTIFGDMQHKFLTIHKDFLDADLGIYIGDTAKDLRDKQTVDMGVQQLLSNSQDPDIIRDAIKVLQADTASESLGIFDRTIERLKKSQEQAQQAEAENNQAIAEQEAAKLASEVEEKQKDRDSQEEIAKIYANNKTFNETEKNTSQELQLIAKLEADEKKERIKADASKDKPTPKPSSSGSANTDKKPVKKQ